MTLRTTSIALTTLLVLAASACTGDSDGVDVPGADTTVVVTAPSTASTPSTTPPIVTELPTPTPAPSTTGAPASTATVSSEAPTTTGAEPPATDVAPETTQARNPDFLRQGDEGPRVGVIQFKLVVLGYLPSGGDTGVFDSATNSAVLAFQGDYGLIVDGIIGPETERAISAAAESINPEQ